MVVIPNLLEENDKYKKGVAFSTYVNEDTGHFEYVYRVITRETQDEALDQLPLTTYWTGKVREQGINAGNQDQLCLREEKTQESLWPSKHSRGSLNYAFKK